MAAGGCWWILWILWILCILWILWILRILWILGALGASSCAEVTMAVSPPWPEHGGRLWMSQEGGLAVGLSREVGGLAAPVPHSTAGDIPTTELLFGGGFEGGGCPWSQMEALVLGERQLELQHSPWWEPLGRCSPFLSACPCSWTGSKLCSLQQKVPLGLISWDAAVSACRQLVKREGDRGCLSPHLAPDFGAFSCHLCCSICR